MLDERRSLEHPGQAGGEEGPLLVDPVTGAPRKFAYVPSLVVVDGGPPQVSAAAAAMDELGIDDVALCGLAKRLEEVWLPGEDFPVILPRTSEALYLLQRVRDEAHRFAITFHRQKRSKRMTASGLDNIPGLGETRRKALLRHFGSLKRLGQASPEEITEVPGIGRRTAEAVLAALDAGGGVGAAAKKADESAAEAGAMPAGGAGRTRSRASQSRLGLPAPAQVKTSSVRAAIAEAGGGETESVGVGPGGSADAADAGGPGGPAPGLGPADRAARAGRGTARPGETPAEEAGDDAGIRTTGTAHPPG
jgi:excinuclease ABC subunit C